MSVNLSSAQLLKSDLDNDIRNVLAVSHCRPGSLKLELTESVVMQHPEQAAIVLKRVKALGISLALDDFGTGHSSLSYLTRFPFDTLKIDRSLVRDTSEKRPALLRSIITMAKDLDMTIVAEGVQTEKDVAELAEMGCDFAQSYIFGEPASADATLRLLRDHFPLARTA